LWIFTDCLSPEIYTLSTYVKTGRCALFASGLKETAYHPSQEVKKQVFWYSFIGRSENLVGSFIIIYTLIS
jgi:hypothetical protein